jgi:hypothetical protein
MGEAKTRCSFCHRLRSQVRCIVGFEAGATICNECVVRVDAAMRDAAVETRIASATEKLRIELAQAQAQLHRLQADEGVKALSELRQYTAYLEAVVAAVRQPPVGYNAASAKALADLDEWLRRSAVYKNKSTMGLDSEIKLAYGA